MAEQKASQYMQSLPSRAARVYSINYSAHRPGITPKESTEVYDQWMTYDEDLNHQVYHGPEIAAKAVGEFFAEKREALLVLDVACGTGFVGLDPSLKLLEKARDKNVFQRDFQCYLDDKRLPVDSDTYDCAVIAGGMGEGHIPTAGLYELARVVKPGGLVCIVMREEYLEHVEDYRDRLEKTMKEMEGANVWTMAERVIVPRYSFDNNGVVFKFVVC